ncbi:MAG: hypothetical protein ACO3FQ_01910 [Terrimicrobiaceae bacterium]
MLLDFLAGRGRFGRENWWRLALVGGLFFEAALLAQFRRPLDQPIHKADRRDDEE